MTTAISNNAQRKLEWCHHQIVKRASEAWSLRLNIVVLITIYWPNICVVYKHNTKYSKQEYDTLNNTSADRPCSSYIINSGCQVTVSYTFAPSRYNHEFLDNSASTGQSYNSVNVAALYDVDKYMFVTTRQLNIANDKNINPCACFIANSLFKHLIAIWFSTMLFIRFHCNHYIPRNIQIVLLWFILLLCHHCTLTIE